ncbi:hypothetical protein VC279_19925 [Xanthomonas sp. WHRI 10064A]|uniref:hypothetical protein n=1 Tax=unclassified Xanthomonas TaxID=2643310 RepID=UPI002B22B435|nr:MULTISPECIES: hypothetical protein [unclassified Xanthomonas]MEA9589194.1 hypothetical protein [Xanthomonas sp. WHRI 10064B]MEA9616883.1 hypothetical protein [Xanthomonas sp. WHRI 10064A]
MKYKFDLVEATKRFKAEVESVFMDFDSWKTFKTNYGLTWKRVKFEKGNVNNVPDVRGIYIFTLQVDENELPIHGYIWYMGIAGHRSAHTLRKRYGNYIYDQRSPAWKRPKVRYMLQKWKEDLYFNFVELDTGVNLKTIESAFLNAIIPPANLADINATISMPRKAAAL